jgi:hypothetical protein
MFEPLNMKSQRSPLPGGPGRSAARVRALTLIEVLVASLILLIAIPPLIDTATTIARMDRAREGRSHATNLEQMAIEHLRHRLYQEDDRGYRLGDDDSTRRSRYSTSPPSWLATLHKLSDADSWIVDLPSRSADAQSVPFTRFFGRDNPVKLYPWSGSDTRDNVVYQGLTSVTNPELSREIESYRLAVSVKDYPVGADPSLRTKEPASPKVDLVDVGLTIRWRDLRGQETSQIVTTRMIRTIGEPDPTLSSNGGI